jgi:hypothetical protein
MPFSLYAVLLTSQLVVPIADHVPEFDVRPTCREATVPDCLGMEKIARQKLVEAWSQFTPQEKATCIMEEKLAGPPSYVGWLTCLQLNANAQNAESMAPGDRTGGETGPATRDGTPSGIHRRHAKH